MSPMSRTDATTMSKLSDRQLRLAIFEGGDAVQKSELMPPWGMTLTAAEIDALLAVLSNAPTGRE